MGYCDFTLVTVAVESLHDRQGEGGSIMRKMVKRYLSMVLIMSLLLNGCGIIGGKGSDIDEEIVGQLVGGFFYGSESAAPNKQAEEFIEVRQEGTVLLKDKLLEASESSRKLSDQYQVYEDFLRDELDQYSLEEKDMLIVQIILNNIIAYRAAIEANEALIVRYSEAKATDDIDQAVLDSYIMESSYHLYTLHTEFVDMMTMNSAKIASMIGQEDMAAAEVMLSTYQQTVTDSIVPSFIEYLYVYKEASTMVNHIASADYYVEPSYISESIELLNKAEDSEYVQQLKKVCEDRLENRETPAYLIEISDNQLRQYGYVNEPQHLFISKVYAGDLDDYAKAIAAVQMIKEVQGQNPEDKKEFYAEATANMILNMAEAKANLEKFDQQHLANYQDMSPTQMLDAYNKTLKENNSQTVPATEILEPDQVEVSRDYSEYQPTIDKINMVRGPVEKLSNFGVGKGLQFDTMILTLSLGLKLNGGKFKPETVQALTKFLKDDLGNILGDKKGTLVNLLLDNKAEDFIDVYLDWKDKSNNFQDLNFDLADIRATLGQLNLRSEDLEGLLHQLVTFYEEGGEPGLLQLLLNLPQIISDLFVSIFTLGFIQPEPEALENGTSILTSDDGQLNKSSKYLNSIQIEKRDFRTSEGEDNIGSYVTTLNDKDGNIMEEMTYTKGVKVSHAYYEKDNEKHRKLYTDIFENGKAVDRDHSLNPNMRLTK